MSTTLTPRDPNEAATTGDTRSTSAEIDITNRLRYAAAMLNEAADTIDFLRKQSRGHFEALTAVLRDGIEAVTPAEFGGKAGKVEKPN